MKIFLNFFPKMTYCSFKVTFLLCAAIMNKSPYWLSVHLWVAV